MKNLKKLFAVIVAVAMLATFAIPAFAAVPSDVEGTECEDAVTRLVALGIVTGRPDGTYAPEENISRAEFAAIVVRALGAETAAGGAKGQTKFTDVPASHWASGYINLANSMGIVNGRPDGTFAPSDPVRYEEAITMIVRALGYEPKASALGGYPNGYLTIAAEKEITDAVDVINGVAATRGDVALMVDASLDVPMMVQSTWGEYPEYEEDEDKTLLSKLGVDEIEEKMVTAVPKTDSSLEENEIEIDGDVYTVVGDFDVDSLLGVEVNAWAEDDEVFFIEVSTDEDDIKFDTVAAADANDVTLKVDDEEYDWADDATVWVNFEEVDPEDVPDNAYGYFVFDKDEVVAANLFEFASNGVGVVTSVDDEEIIYRDATDATEDEIDLDNAEEIYVYNSDFTMADLGDIDEDSAIFFWADSDDNYYIVVSNEIASGTLERIKSAEVKVSGDSYDRAAEAIFSKDDKEGFDEWTGISDIEDLGDEDVVIVLDLNGDALFIYGDSEATSDTMYGVVTYAEVRAEAEATVFTKDGEEVDYVFEERTDASSIDYDSTFDYFATDTTGLDFAVMKFKLNADGEIDKDYLAGDGSIDAIDYTSLPTTELLKDADKNYVYVDADGSAATTGDRTKYYISEDTIFIKALNSDGKLDPTVLDYETIYESAINLDGTDSIVFVYGTAGRDADMIVFLDKDFSGEDDDYYYGVVTDSPWLDGDDYVATIDVFGEGEAEYVVANSTYFSEGDVVKFHFNSDNEIEQDAVGTADSDDSFDYDDGYVINTDDGDVKADADAVVYSLNTDGTIDEKVKVSDVDEYDYMTYILDEDGVFVAAVVSNSATPDSSDAEATITANAFLTAPASEVTVKLTPGSGETAADYQLMVYDANGFVSAHAFNAADVTDDDGEIFTAGGLSLVDNTDYTLKVVKLADGTVLDEIEVTTLDVTP